MGATGYVYASAKDACKDHGLAPKRWMPLLRAIGQYMALGKEEWAKAKKEKTTGTADISSALIAAFGDGKQSK